MTQLIECGCCSCLHPIGFHGECRDDNNRYTCLDDYCERTGESNVEVIELDDPNYDDYCRIPTLQEIANAYHPTT